MCQNDIYGWKTAEQEIKAGIIKSIKDVENFYRIYS